MIEGFLLAVCVVTSIFNLVMFVICVKVRNDCMQIKDVYIKATGKAEKILDDAKGAMLCARSEMIQIIEELHEIINEGDGDC